MSDWDKGREYAGMVHFGQSQPALPGNVVGATYFHLDTAYTASRSTTSTTATATSTTSSAPGDSLAG